MYLVYLAGPITGCTFDQCVDWREYVIGKLPPEITGLSPMRGKTYLEGLSDIAKSYEDDPDDADFSRLEHVMSSSRGIISRDFNDCRRADALIVNFLGATKISVGTVMEVAWAKAFNVPVIAVMEKGNIHEYPMLTECIGFRVDNIDQAINVVNMLLLPVAHRNV